MSNPFDNSSDPYQERSSTQYNYHPKRTFQPPPKSPREYEAKIKELEKNIKDLEFELSNLKK